MANLAPQRFEGISLLLQLMEYEYLQVFESAPEGISLMIFLSQTWSIDAPGLVSCTGEQNSPLRKANWGETAAYMSMALSPFCCIYQRRTEGFSVEFKIDKLLLIDV